MPPEMQYVCPSCGCPIEVSLEGTTLFGISLRAWMEDGRVIDTVREVMSNKRMDPEEWSALRDKSNKYTGKRS